jgi:hypothetical protein
MNSLIMKKIKPQNRLTIRNFFCFVLLFVISFEVLACLSPKTEILNPLKVSNNKRYLVHSDGTPFFWLGDTGWSLFHRLTKEDAVFYLQTRKNQGFNIIQAAAIFDQAGGPGNKHYNIHPYNGNLSNLNEEYFKHVDFIIDAAEKLGLYIALLPVWSHNQAGKIVTINNAEEYGRFLGNRYKDKSIIWVLGGDDGTRHEELWRAMAKGIAIGMSGKEDYNKMLMTYHPIGNETSSTTFHNDEWLDFNMVQSGHCRDKILSYHLIEHDYEISPAKPVIDAEPLYEKHIICWDPAQGVASSHEVRKFAYWAVFTGAFGHTYGHHNIWPFTTGTHPMGKAGLEGHWKDFINDEAGTQMKHLRSLMESRPFQTGIPDQGIISFSDNGFARIQATRASDGAYLMIYSPDGNPFSANLDILSGKKVKAYWYNPRTGKVTIIKNIKKGESVKFNPPTSGEGNDWVLVVDDSSRKFSIPGVIK